MRLFADMTISVGDEDRLPVTLDAVLQPIWERANTSSSVLEGILHQRDGGGARHMAALGA